MIGVLGFLAVLLILWNLIGVANIFDEPAVGEQMTNAAIMFGIIWLVLWAIFTRDKPKETAEEKAQGEAALREQIQRIREELGLSTHSHKDERE